MQNRSGVDPRVRLAAVAVPGVLASITLQPWAMLLLFATVVALQFWARVRFADIRRVMPLLILACGLILVLHLVFTKSDQTFPAFGMSLPGPLRTGLLYSWRMVIFVGLALSFARLIRAHEFAEIVWRSLALLRVFRVPANSLGLALTLAVRFIPTIRREYERIRLAQQLRGTKSVGGLFARTRSYVPLLVPVFTSSLRRSETLGDALEVRGWGVAARRTFFKEWRMRQADWIISALLLALTIGVWVLS